MARYRKVHVRVWTDARFRRLSPPPPSGRYLWMYLLTCKEAGVIPGLISIGEAALAEALEWPIEGLRAAFAELEREGMAKADWKARLIWLPRGIEYGRPDNPSVVLSWRVAWDEMPECPLRAEAEALIATFLEAAGPSFGRAFRAVRRLDEATDPAPKGGADGVGEGARAAPPDGARDRVRHGARHQEIETEKEIPPAREEPEGEEAVEDPFAPAPRALRAGTASKPLDAHSLVQCLRVAVEREHPEGGFYDAGPFAHKEADEMFRQVPADRLADVSEQLYQRVQEFARAPDQQGWTVRSFRRWLNSIRGGPRAAEPQVVTAAPARAYYDPAKEARR